MGWTNPEHTPVISALQLSRIEELTSTARQNRRACGCRSGARLERRGYFMAPTILADVDSNQSRGPGRDLWARDLL